MPKTIEIKGRLILLSAYFPCHTSSSVLITSISNAGTDKALTANSGKKSVNSAETALSSRNSRKESWYFFVRRVRQDCTVIGKYC